jgi:MoaA/NifB/PqqE/SkfB family radical SAM enzyme
VDVPDHPGEVPIFQIHPTRRCNLACRHCYSQSGPSKRDELRPELVCGAIRDTAAIGYRVASISGGEPFMYEGLVDILKCARSAGMRTSVTTNGFFLDDASLDSVGPFADLIAVSFDGPPEQHNRIRSSRKAFDRLVEGLEKLRDRQLRFGLIHTLTNKSWEHLLWIAQFAAENGARLLQIHPLEPTGRAPRAMLADDFPDDDTHARAYLLTAALAAKYQGRMTLQLDLLHRSQVLENPALIGGCPDASIPALHVGPLRVLVLQTNGTIVPSAHGLSSRYAVCNVHYASLRDSWPRFVSERLPAFASLCRNIFAEIARDERKTLFNWHQLLVAQSQITESGHTNVLPSTASH